jgi:hypothetical protein
MYTVHRCRARRKRGDCRSGGEGRGGSLRWRERARGRPTGRCSWHEPPPERDGSNWAGAMLNGSHATDDESGREGERRAVAFGRGGEKGWWSAECIGAWRRLESGFENGCGSDSD